MVSSFFSRHFFPCVILSAAKKPGVQESVGIELNVRALRSSSAPRALSEVEVYCTEKDPGFFAALRMTQKKSAPGVGLSTDVANPIRAVLMEV